jgi:hypothetical protein
MKLIIGFTILASLICGCGAEITPDQAATISFGGSYTAAYALTATGSLDIKTSEKVLLMVQSVSLGIESFEEGENAQAYVVRECFDYINRSPDIGEDSEILVDAAHWLGSLIKLSTGAFPQYADKSGDWLRILTQALAGAEKGLVDAIAKTKKPTFK